MNEIGQGAMIYGVRSSKYPGAITYGIIISASCDLAHDKIDKIYYLTAVQLEDWFLSNVGIRIILSNKITSTYDSINNLCLQNKIDVDTLLGFSESECSIVIEETFKSAKDKKDIIESLSKYRKYHSSNLSTEEKKSLLCEAGRRTLRSNLNDLMNRKNTHYIFMPKKAFSDDIMTENGLVIDMQEINYIKKHDFDKLERNEIDEMNLSEDDKNFYNDFFILDNDGFAMLQYGVKSPWCEYMMQHFSNSFTRIGVDTLDGKEIDDLINKILEEKKT